jgi:hypothetical protein
MLNKGFFSRLLAKVTWVFEEGKASNRVGVRLQETTSKEHKNR